MRRDRLRHLHLAASLLIGADHALARAAEAAAASPSRAATGRVREALGELRPRQRRAVLAMVAALERPAGDAQASGAPDGA